MGLYRIGCIDSSRDVCFFSGRERGREGVSRVLSWDETFFCIYCYDLKASRLGTHKAKEYTSG